MCRKINFVCNPRIIAYDIKNNPVEAIPIDLDVFTIKSRTSARILLIQPFLLETVDPAKQALCEELARKQTIVKRLADEYADAYLPLDEILHQEVNAEPVDYSADGVHPTSDGACRIGEAYLGAVAPLIELLS